MPQNLRRRLHHATTQTGASELSPHDSGPASTQHNQPKFISVQVLIGPDNVAPWSRYEQEASQKTLQSA